MIPEQLLDILLCGGERKTCNPEATFVTGLFLINVWPRLLQHIGIWLCGRQDFVAPKAMVEDRQLGFPDVFSICEIHDGVIAILLRTNVVGDFESLSTLDVS